MITTDSAVFESGVVAVSDNTDKVYKKFEGVNLRNERYGVEDSEID